MKWLILIALVLVFATASTAKGQSTACPQGQVCYTADEARQILARLDELKAVKAENETLTKTVIPALKDEIHKVQLDFVRSDTGWTECKANQVSDRAIIEILLKYARAKKLGAIVF